MIFGAIILLTWVFQTRLRVANFEPRFLSVFKKWRKNVIPFSRRLVGRAGWFGRLSDSISVYIGPSPRKREKEEN